MRKTWMACAAMVAGGMVAGIGCKKEQPTATPPPAKPPVVAPASPTGPGPSVPLPAPTSVPAATLPAAVAPTANDAGAGEADPVAKEAQAKLDAVTQWVRESKFDQADLALKKLEGEKAQLPPAMLVRLGAARRLVDNAKLTSGGVKVPDAGLNK